jgi:microsomal prostaglandin-E synthase 2
MHAVVFFHSLFRYHLFTSSPQHPPAQIPYRCIEVNPLTKAELKWTDYRKVPVVLIDGKQINDSSAIMSQIQAAIEAAAIAESESSSGSGSEGWLGWLRPAAGGGTRGVQRDEAAVEEERWRRWVDTWLVRVITVNIYRNAKESFQTFDYITHSGNFGYIEK